MTATLGPILKQARQLRGMSGVQAARASGISAAYLSKLEGGSVKRPSPNVLHQLSEILSVPYSDLMRLCGYLVPGETDRTAASAVSAALFADVTDDERNELLEYLAWYRARRRSRRAVGRHEVGP